MEIQAIKTKEFSGPDYRPNGLWCKHDFSINKHYWRKVGYQSALDIRTRNLIDVRTILCQSGITNWLQGRTLLGIFKYGELQDDHDDDIGVFDFQRSLVLTNVRKNLEEKGFSLIRDTDDIASFERNYRYIDICFFRAISERKFGYAKKTFSKEHFSHFEKLNWNKIDFDIPASPDKLLLSMYPPHAEESLVNQDYTGMDSGRLVILWEKRHKAFVYIKDAIKSPKLFLHYFKAVFGRGKRLGRRLIKLIYRNICHIHPFVERVYMYLMRLAGIKIIILSEEDFLDLLIEPKDSFNWKWRIRHLELVTDNGKYQKIRDIINYLESPETRHLIDSRVEETDTSIPFFPPTNYDMRFWWGGNNYFWYCVKYVFRKNVVPYSKANAYIHGGKKPFLYTGEYYQSLPEMSDAEIRNLLISDPIEISDGAVTSGKHRVFAMIGRLLNNKPYIPFRAEVRS